MKRESIEMGCQAGWSRERERESGGTEVVQRLSKEGQDEKNKESVMHSAQRREKEKKKTKSRQAMKSCEVMSCPSITAGDRVDLLPTREQKRFRHVGRPRDVTMGCDGLRRREEEEKIIMYTMLERP